MTAAHIFPLSLGQMSMEYIFGEDAEDEINRARNGLFLTPLVDRAYDAHQITIVPDGPQTVPQDRGSFDEKLRKLHYVLMTNNEVLIKKINNRYFDVGWCRILSTLSIRVDDYITPGL
jgi:HNH endonuclease